MHALRHITLFVLLAAAAVSCGSPHTHDAMATAPELALPEPAAPDKAAFDMMAPPAMAEMMAQAQPGPEHETLARYAGEWNGVATLNPAPGMPPMTEMAPASCRMILGGRFLEVKSAGEMMGTPFDSLSLFGFDRRNKVWTLVGFDTLGTYFVTGAGTEDADGVIRMHGRDDSPMGPQQFFFEVEWVSDDEFVSSVYFTQTGPQIFDEPFKMVEVRYTRQ